MSETAGVLDRGHFIRDNDPRMPNRKLQIVEFIERPGRRGGVKAICRLCGWKGRERYFEIDVRRIHVDGKPRRSGFSWLAP